MDCGEGYEKYDSDGSLLKKLKEKNIYNTMDERTSRHSPEKEYRQINKIHFLIHPGFDADPNTLLRKAKTELNMPLKDEFISAQQSLLKYKSVAESMNQDEIMIAFLHPEKSDIKTDIKDNQPYLEVIKSLKAILGNRLITLGGDFKIAT